jgi:hypothetical protein
MKVAILFAMLAGTAAADAPVVDAVSVNGGRFDVTLSHPDTGWDHYADGWRVEDQDGNVLGTRVLGHPHVTEQPFTRSLKIDGPLPAIVYVRSRCIVDGWSQTTFEVATQ